MLKGDSKYLWIFINTPEGPHLGVEPAYQATITALQRKMKESTVCNTCYSAHYIVQNYSMFKKKKSDSYEENQSIRKRPWCWKQ